MHSTKELAKMERKEKQAKEQEKVNAVKRRLQFEEKERKEEEEKKNEEMQKEKELRKQKTPVKKRNVKVVSLFSSDEELPVKKGKIEIHIHIEIQFVSVDLVTMCVYVV